MAAVLRGHATESRTNEMRAIIYFIMIASLASISTSMATLAIDDLAVENPSNLGVVLELNDSNVNDVLSKYPLFVLDCYDPWCEPCKELNATLHELSGELKDQISFGSIDVESNEETAKRYNITAYPTILFFKNGTLVDSQEGYGSKSELLMRFQMIEPKLNVSNVKLDEMQIMPESSPYPDTSSGASEKASSAVDATQRDYSARSGLSAEMLVPPLNVSSSDVVLDISPGATRYIDGAVNINYENFLSEGSRLKPAPEIARMLADAGISRNDSVVVTGECLPCGGGPSPAIFTYWLLKYLGHEKVRVLDGSIEDWVAAGLNTSDKPAARPKTNYMPSLRPEILATYDFVVNGGAQVVDARPAGDFDTGSIPGAINIPYEDVLENERIKQEEVLQKVFTDLRKDLPVVVYTNVGVEASLVWFALTLSGYDARLYSWRDWLENQPKFNFELIDIVAKPNPVRSGDVTTITASFREKQTIATRNSSGGEIKLTVKGCATCGFGSPQGFANLDRKNGFVQIGSNGKASGSASKAINELLLCSAVINGPDSLEVGRTSLRQTSENNYVGIWNANVPPGVYSVDIVVSASGNADVLTDVLKIEVTG